MQQFEYKVVPAPMRGEKVRGARTTAERFAAALMALMNDLGRDGWEYLRADTLPCEERVGLTGKSSSFLHMLVFRRPLASAAPASQRDPGPQEGADQEPAPVARTALLALAPEGTAPRVTSVVKPALVPPVGPARDPASPAD
jgi:hypothetical protein